MEWGQPVALTDSDAPAGRVGFFDEPPLPGPRARELVSLATLAGIAQRHRAASDWTQDTALSRILDALRGRGNPPVGLAVDVPVYVWTHDRFRPLHAERPRVDPDAGVGVVYPSERDTRLDEAMPMPLHAEGATMELARRLAVHVFDALDVFGVPPESLGLPSPGLQAVPPSLPARPAIGRPGGGAGKLQWERTPHIRLELNRQFDALVEWYELQPTRAANAASNARSDLAEAWGVSVSTVKQQTTGEPRKLAQSSETGRRRHRA